MRFLSHGFLLYALVAAFFGAIWLSSASCKKDKLLSNGGELRFSTDTVAFDTVFTALGSATVGVKIFNPQDQRVVLSSVRLGNGSASFFHLNVDGREGSAASNIEIAANDSIYVFATVKVDPTNANTPFIIEDRLIATLNGSDFSVPMIAFGQNAHYITDSLLDTSLPWLTDKPYVIFGAAVVDSGRTLTIPAGCRIYMHANARLFIDGTLKATGTKQDSIIFQGDRLDRAYFGYEGYPGEWGGIYFTRHSTGSELTHVILRNGGNAAQGTPPALIQVEPDSSSRPGIAQLTLDKVILENSIGYGLLAFAGSINMRNCLIHSCGASALALVQGGTYNLDYCTITTYGNNKVAHNDNPVAIFLNYYPRQGQKPLLGNLNVTVRNCVISGSLENEFVADSTDEDGTKASLKLSNCFLKADAAKTRPWVQQDQTVRYLTTGAAYDSLFRNAARNDYHPSSASVLIDMAMALPGLDRDLEENNRGVPPDVGCYEAR